ncbi:Uncharacterised protein [Bordetella holmesii]|nr:Uncharacterised protein [Bordetella holmesii]
MQYAFGSFADGLHQAWCGRTADVIEFIARARNDMSAIVEHGNHPARDQRITPQGLAQAVRAYLGVEGVIGGFAQTHRQAHEQTCLACPSTGLHTGDRHGFRAQACGQQGVRDARGAVSIAHVQQYPPRPIGQHKTIDALQTHDLHHTAAQTGKVDMAQLLGGGQHAQSAFDGVAVML